MYTIQVKKENKWCSDSIRSTHDDVYIGHLCGVGELRMVFFYN